MNNERTAAQRAGDLAIGDLLRLQLAEIDKQRRATAAEEATAETTSDAPAHPEEHRDR